MAEKFDPQHAHRLENPERLVELPPQNILKLLSLTGAETVVDFGAGTGMYTVPVAQALPDGRVLAVDEHDELLAYLRDKLAAADVPEGRVTVVATRENRVPLPDGGADRVLIINVLHHIWDEPAALGELRRLLAPGGRLVVVEFAQMERPVGPPNDHVLSWEELREVVDGLGVAVLESYQPGEIGRYHNALVAVKPAA